MAETYITLFEAYKRSTNESVVKHFCILSIVIYLVVKHFFKSIFDSCKLG